MPLQNILWKPHPGPQTNAFTCDCDEVMFGGGRGCVHPDTLLDTPSGQVKIKDWNGGPIYSYKGGKTIVTYGTPSVRGSKEDMYEVTLTSGKKVTCTDEHKFLTNNGWKLLKELDLGSSVVSVVGSLLHANSFFLHRSIEGVSLSESQQDVQRSTGRLVNYQGDCSPCCRQYGQPPRSAVDSAQASPPSQDDEHLRSFHALFRSGALESSGKHNPSSASRHVSSRGVPPVEEDRSSEALESCTCGKSSESPSVSFQESELSLLYKALDQLKHKPVLQVQVPYFLTRQVRNLRKVFHRLSAFLSDKSLFYSSLNPKGVEVANDCIVSIRKVNPLHYWDLHVPETNCYFAQGILHHNSGKSSMLFGKVLQHVEKNRGKSKMIFFRENFDDLADLIDKGKDILQANGVADFISGQTRTFRFRPPFDGAWLKMRQIEHIDDLKKYKGHEYTLIGFDEICDFKLPFEQINDTFMACMRNPHGIKGQIIYTGNPGGYNHTAVKKYFIDPWPSGNRILRNEFGQTRAFFQSTVKDNPSLYKDETYMRQLQRIKDPALRKAWLNGDWSVTLGAMFSDVWRPTEHVLNYSIVPNEIPQHFDRFRVFDWGSSTPFCCLRCFISTGEELNNTKRTVFPAGSVVFYNEYYGWQPGNKTNEGLRLSSHEVAKEIRRREVEDGDNLFLQPGPADNQIFQVLDGTPIYDAFFKQNVTFVNSIKSAGSNATGWELIRNRLIGYEDVPQIYFTRDCVHTIRTLPNLSRHKIHLDRLADYQEDHCLTANTKITTVNGDLPIEEIVPGMHVKTRVGYRQVVFSGCTNRKTKVSRIELNTCSLEGTQYHPVFTLRQGWTYIRDVKENDLMIGDTPWLRTLLSLTESNLGDTRTPQGYVTDLILSQPHVTGEEALRRYTEKYGNFTKEKSQTVSTFIMPTLILSIMILPILSWFLLVSTYLSTVKISNLLKRITGKLLKRQKNGTIQKTEEHGTKNMQESCGIKEKLSNIHASIVVKLISAGTELGSGVSVIRNVGLLGVGLVVEMMSRGIVSFAEKLLLSISTQQRKRVPNLVQRVIKVSEQKSVYNMKVEGRHEYYANGFLVHNCADCIKYMLLNLNALHTPETMGDIMRTRSSHDRMVQELFNEEF